MSQKSFRWSDQIKPMFWLLLGVVLATTAFLLQPFFQALMWATVLSVLCSPIYRKFKERMESEKSGAWVRERAPTLASLATVLCLLLLVGLPLGAAGTVAGFQATRTYNEMVAENPEGTETKEIIARELDKTLQPVIKNLGLADDFSVERWVTENGSEFAPRLAGPIATGAGRLVVTLVSMVIALLTMFFMLRDGHLLKKPFSDVMPFREGESYWILDRLNVTIHAVFRGIVLVALIQGTLGGVAYYLFGVNNALLWGMLTFVLCCIPLLGAPVVYIPLALQLILTGKVGQGIGLLAFGFIFLSLIDNVLRPIFIKADLSPIVLFFALLGGVLFFGPVGVFAGPLLITLLYCLVRIMADRKRAEDGEEEGGGDATPAAEPVG